MRASLLLSTRLHSARSARPPRRSRWRGLTLLAALALVALGLAAGPAAAAASLLANGSFATGSTAGWTCSAGDTVVTSPVAPGSSFALSGTPTSGDDAQCSQVVSVQPSSSYTLTGQVEGDYVYLGDSGTGAADTSSWTPSAATWTALSTSFSTGPSTTSVTIYVHGWYVQPTFFAGDLVLTGPAGAGAGGGGGGGATAPAAPAGLAVTGTTSSSVSLAWTAPAGTVTSYNVLKNGTTAVTVTGTSTTITGLAASTAFTFTVEAVNSAGTSPPSAQVSATTAAPAGGGGGPTC
jgi:hypothetical protein